MKDQAKSAYRAAIAGGALLWLATAALSGRTEAWDSPLYWTITYPLTVGLAGWLGYRAPERPWRWGLSALLAQAVALAVTAADFGLLPLGLLLFSVLALPAVGLARFTAGLRLRREDSR